MVETWDIRANKRHTFLRIPVYARVHTFSGAGNLSICAYVARAHAVHTIASVAGLRKNKKKMKKTEKSNALPAPEHNLECINIFEDENMFWCVVVTPGQLNSSPNDVHGAFHSTVHTFWTNSLVFYFQ